jgi:hypothetical protein
MTEFDAEMIAVAKELLTEFGAVCSVEKASGSTYDPDTLSSTPTGVGTFGGVLAYIDPSNSKLTGYERDLHLGELKIGGRWFLFFSEEDRLENGYVVIQGGKRMFVHAGTDIGPDGTLILQRVATKEIQ